MDLAQEARRRLAQLDLEPGATFEQVKTMRRTLVKVWHPDRFEGEPEIRATAEEKLKQINGAFAWLSEHRAVLSSLGEAGTQAIRSRPPRSAPPARAKPHAHSARTRPKRRTPPATSTGTDPWLWALLAVGVLLALVTAPGDDRDRPIRVSAAPPIALPPRGASRPRIDYRTMIGRSPHFVRVPRLDVRADPSMNSEVVAMLNRGERLDVLTRYLGWSQVSGPLSTSPLGWVESDHLSMVRPE